MIQRSTIHVPKGNITARSLYDHAQVFSEAADLLHRSKFADPLPKCFLWGRTIELVLKSFLITRGIPVMTLKSTQYGHDLNALWCAARECEIEKLIGREAVHTGIVRILNLDYMSKRFEYRESKGEYTLPDTQITRQLIQRLLRGVAFHLAH
jgi:hypothetical protein